MHQKTAHTKIKKLLTIVCLSLLSPLVLFGLAYGGGGGEGGSGGGNPEDGCANSHYLIDTCHGAGWKKYSLLDRPPGVTVNNDGDEIIISNTIAPGYTVVAAQTTVLRGCKSAGATEYYRHGFFAWQLPAGTPPNIRVGDQIGVVSIGRSTNEHYLPVAFGGKLNYSKYSTVSWDEAKAKYLEGKGDPNYGHLFNLGWDKLSPLAAFCYNKDWFNPSTPPPPASVITSSSAKSSGQEANTGFTTNKTANITITVNHNNPVDVTFTHQAKTLNGDASQIAYRIFRYTRGANDNRQVANGSFPNAAGASPKTHTHSVRVNKNSTVCEVIKYKAGGKDYYTEACATVKADNTPPSPPPNACSDSNLIHSSYTNSNKDSGTTSSHSEVSGNGQVGKNGAPIYVKPGDNISFLHCYFPGAQKVMKHQDHGHPRGGDFSGCTGPTCRLPRSGCYGSRDIAVELHNMFKISTKNGNNATAPFTDYNYSKPTGTNYANIVATNLGPREVLGRAVEDQEIVQNFNTFAGRSYANPCGPWELGSYKYYYYQMVEVPVEPPEYEQCWWDPNQHCLKTHWVNKKIEATGTAYGYHVPDCYQGTSGTSYGSSSHATVKIPYNFKNSITAEIKSSEVFSFSNIVYGGHTAKVKATATVSQRNNPVTKGTYATVTPKTTQTGLYVFWLKGNESAANSEQILVGDQTGNRACNALGGRNCHPVKSRKGALNTSYNKNGSTEEVFNINNLNVFDIPAGSQFCVAASIFPAESATDNISPSNEKTYLSKPSCVRVAKKPSFQVWGGNVYSNGKINTSLSQKNTLFPLNNYIVEGTTNGRTFGSFAEHMIIGSSSISGFASGAANGYGYAPPESAEQGNGMPDLSLPNPYGGSPINQSNHQKHFSKFTVANSVPGNVGYSGIQPSSSHKNTFLARYSLPTASQKVSGSINLSAPSSYVEKEDIRRTHALGNLTISATQELAPGTTHFVSVDGSLTINNLPASNRQYHDIYAIPQYIIYAKGNITIDCSITKLDAILITDGTLSTCENQGFDSSTRSTKLQLNGFIIANQLVLNRSYGAGYGKHSPVPAEIINLSPATFFWSQAQAEKRSNFVNAYTRELAPRY